MSTDKGGGKAPLSIMVLPNDALATENGKMEFIKIPFLSVKQIPLYEVLP